MDKVEMLNKLGTLTEAKLQKIIDEVFNAKASPFSCDFVKPSPLCEEDIEGKYNFPINEKTQLFIDKLVKENKQRFEGLAEEEKYSYAIIDFEEERTCFIFIENGVVRNRSCPVGNYTIACQIAKEFQLYSDDRLNTKQGSELRDRHGYVAMGGNYADATSEIASKIGKIIRNVMTRIHTELVRSINGYRSTLGGKRPCEYYLAGSLATMHNMKEFWVEKVGFSDEETIQFLDPKDAEQYKKYYVENPKVKPEQIVVIEKSQRPPNEQKYHLPELPSVGGYGVMDRSYLSASACREKAIDFMVAREFDQAIDYFGKAIERYGNFDEKIDNYITECLVGRYENGINLWKEYQKTHPEDKDNAKSQIKELKKILTNLIKERKEMIDERYGKNRVNVPLKKEMITAENISKII